MTQQIASRARVALFAVLAAALVGCDDDDIVIGPTVTVTATRTQTATPIADAHSDRTAARRGCRGDRRQSGRRRRERWAQATAARWRCRESARDSTAVSAVPTGWSTTARRRVRRPTTVTSRSPVSRPGRHVIKVTKTVDGNLLRAQAADHRRRRWQRRSRRRSRRGVSRAPPRPTPRAAPRCAPCSRPTAPT